MVEKQFLQFLGNRVNSFLLKVVFDVVSNLVSRELSRPKCKNSDKKENLLCELY